MVAEKKSVCLFAGMCFNKSVISLINPKANIKSASSIHRIFTLSIFRCPCETRSNILPGVATSTSTPSFSFAICGSCSTPPKIQAETTLDPFPIFWKTPVICNANSRVGASTKQVIPGVFLCFSKRVFNNSMIGITNAAVFPVPVWAIANTSSPRRIGSIALNWMSVGL